MTKQENLHGMANAVINAAFVLQLSWIPVIFFLEGADWVTASVAVRAHRLALAYTVLVPLYHGVRLWRSGRRAELLRPWLLRCQLPLALFAAFLYGFERFGPSLSLPRIGGLMAAVTVVGLYSIVLRREARTTS